MADDFATLISRPPTLDERTMALWLAAMAAGQPSQNLNADLRDKDLLAWAARIRLLADSLLGEAGPSTAGQA
ncbi:MAG: hypothetical protein U1A27_00190 [Phycisphaerae bacterium]